MGSKLNRSAKLEDEADVKYTIETPFRNDDAQILLVDRGENKVEVIVGDIPMPNSYNVDQNYPDLLENDDTMKEHAVAEWIFSQNINHFEDYDWETSSYVTNNPNVHLTDIYFTCDIGEVNDAVMASKKFITEMEDACLQHAKEFGSVRNGPREDIEK